MAINTIAYFVNMKQLKTFILLCFLLISQQTIAQTEIIPVFNAAIKANREKTYNNIIKNSITKNLSLPLTDSTEENWEAAFYAMELINYNQPWVNEKLKIAFDKIEKRSVEFQRSVIEMVYAQQLKDFIMPANKLLRQTKDIKIFAMCAEYLLLFNKQPALITTLLKLCKEKVFTIKDEKEYAITRSILGRVVSIQKKYKDEIIIQDVFAKTQMKASVIIYSIQRKNRNYPGIVVVRDTAGNFITNSNNEIFYVPQLARSITNLPGYLTNGNTPQGIFRMDGFAVSKSAAIGPTENIQLTMPFETTIQHFLKDSTITDTTWTLGLYKQLLPAAFNNYYPLFETFYASQAQRTEIIAHGTTVDPDYYKGKLYYPYTPTQGCLCAKEIWSTIDGKRIISDQQKLIDAVKKAGGANGYVIVVEIDDQQKPVSIAEILPYLKK